jgi:hypothetical protein
VLYGDRRSCPASDGRDTLSGHENPLSIANTPFDANLEPQPVPFLLSL